MPPVLQNNQVIEVLPTQNIHYIGDPIEVQEVEVEEIPQEEQKYVMVIEIVIQVRIIAMP